jgi:hypothetical protein
VGSVPSRKPVGVIRYVRGYSESFTTTVEKSLASGAAMVR